MFCDLQRTRRLSAPHISARCIYVRDYSLVNILEDLALLQLGDMLVSVHTVCFIWAGYLGWLVREADSGTAVL